MKKLLSVLLVLVLCASLVPVAHADLIDAYFDAFVSAAEGSSYVRAGRLVILNFRSDGLADICSTAAAGNNSFLQIWNAFADSMLETYVGIQQSVDKYSDGTIVVVLNIMDAAAPNTILLTLSEGEILINGANEA